SFTSPTGPTISAPSALKACAISSARKYSSSTTRTRRPESGPGLASCGVIFELSAPSSRRVSLGTLCRRTALLQTAPGKVGSMPNRDIIVIGGSAGATVPLKEILGRLPTDLPAAVFVVLHLPAQGVGILTTVASAASRLPVLQAASGMVIERG